MFDLIDFVFWDVLLNFVCTVCRQFYVFYTGTMVGLGRDCVCVCAQHRERVRRNGGAV